MITAPVHSHCSSIVTLTPLFPSSSPPPLRNPLRVHTQKKVSHPFLSSSSGRSLFFAVVPPYFLYLSSIACCVISSFVASEIHCWSGCLLSLSLLSPNIESSCVSLSTALSVFLRVKTDRKVVIIDRMTQVGLGLLSVDFLATVASYPKPDDKIRSTSLKVSLHPPSSSATSFPCEGFIGPFGWLG